jgi:hypothetical protein
MNLMPVSLQKAVEAIDDKFGNGFAKKNPALVGAYIQAAAITDHAEHVRQIARWMWECAPER